VYGFENFVFNTVIEIMVCITQSGPVVKQNDDLAYVPQLSS
jgi:hypothetical protein